MQAIGFPGVANGVGPAASSSILEAQMSRYRTQLADYCNCPRGKTPAGKEKIQELQNKVDAVKAQLEQIASAKAQRQSTEDRVNRRPDTSAAGNSALPGPGSLGESTLSAARRVTGTAIGGRVDAFA
jgi:hypothetical protein